MIGVRSRLRFATLITVVLAAAFVARRSAGVTPRTHR